MDEASGAIVDGRHVFPIRVYYEDTDAGGVVYYANYLKFAERARTEFLRITGAQHRELMDSENVMMAVRRCEVDYLRPARLDDSLEVHTEITELRGASMWAHQSVMRRDSILARLKLRVACVTREGSPARFPAFVVEALKPFCNVLSTPSQTRV